MFARANGVTLNDEVDRRYWTPPLPRCGSEPRGDGAVTNAAERLRFEARLAAVTGDQLTIQRMIADLVARLATIPTEAIDGAVVDGLRQIGEALQLDRAILWRKAAADATLAVSHYWMRNPQETVPEPLVLAFLPFISSKLEAGQVACFAQIDDLPSADDRQVCLRHGLRSAVVVPVAPAEELSVLAFGSSSTDHYYWTPASIEQLRVVSGVIVQTVTHEANRKALQAAVDELRQLREQTTPDDGHARSNPEASPGSPVRSQLHAGPVCIRREALEQFSTGTIVGQSPAIRKVLEQVQQVAVTDSTVLLLGETGSGKELLATYLHELGARRGRAMVRVNCGAIPTTLIESELFGREKGAYTGALARQIGRFELADRSTIFLDEIGDLPADVQVKLLRVLEERQIERLGSPKAIHVDVRIVAATHQDLEQRILKGAFREDLFYRLNVFPIQIPALRDRADDIPLLVWRFVNDFSKSFGKRIDAISRENMAALQRYSWPGNIRELRNVVERAMIVATGTQLTIALPASPASTPAKRSVKMVDVEKDHLRSVLDNCGWRIRGSCGAAEMLGLRPTTLETRMAKLGIIRPKH
jgi:transcriptional regulator with GAF, ATPase, and Fis domain